MSNLNDSAYIAVLQRVQKTFASRTAGKPVFTVNMDKAKLWEQYLSSFERRQFHNCMACHAFLNRYAGLVVIGDNGKVVSAVWDEDDAGLDPELRAAIRRLAKMAENSKVSDVFYSDKVEFGRGFDGGWRHLHLFNHVVYARSDKTAAQAMAEKREQFGLVNRTMREYSKSIAETAVKLLKSGTLYRAEKVLAQAEWLVNLYSKNAAKDSANLLWLAVANAPEGFAHFGNSMLGSLMADIRAGFTTDVIARRFNEKMDNYKQSKTAPSDNQIAVAEQAVEQLGISPAFARRYTTNYDLSTRFLVWTPTYGGAEPSPRKLPKEDDSGVFDVLKTKKQVAADSVAIPPRTMTLEKFMREVLPSASAIQYRVPEAGRFCALTTAANPDAPPILQWDSTEQRNPVSWAFAAQPAYATDYGLTPGSLATVRAIVQSPTQQEHHSKGLFFLLDGARDTRGLPGGGLFVEHLRADLHPYRRTIEAYMNKQVVSGADNPETMAFGIGLLAGNDWTELAAPEQVQPMPLRGNAPKHVHVFLVLDDSGSMNGYLAAAQKAVRHLISSIKSMPGEVDVTVFKFGNYTHTLLAIGTIEQAERVVVNLNARSGSTALNDCIGHALEMSASMQHNNDTVFFLGIVTDGEENHSTKYSKPDLRNAIMRVQQTGQWTIAYAGAGNRPREYAHAVGIPAGNVKVFEASARGFESAGLEYATATANLAAGYQRGVKGSTTFFSAVSGRQAIGSDYPVMLVTFPNGAQASYRLDRWE